MSWIGGLGFLDLGSLSAGWSQLGSQVPESAITDESGDPLLWTDGESGSGYLLATE